MTTTRRLCLGDSSTEGRWPKDVILRRVEPSDKSDMLSPATDHERP